MHVTEVIKKPVLTEKTYLGHANGVYTFIVDERADKTTIKKTFEEVFEVKVKNVRTMRYDGKDKRVGKFMGKTNRFKKAVITLKDGEQLDILNDL